MSLRELYTKDARVWIPDTELVWKGAVLLESYNGQNQLRVLCDDGEELTINVKSAELLPPLRNPEILLGENDLTSLSYLHEPAVLYNLQVRFCERNYIYTYCGIVLVAINPYQQLPIYDTDTIHAYSGHDINTMDPHIFAVAEEAFKRLSRYNENQSLIVSGESGAGKTVSAKYAMRYFATVCGSETETQIEKRVLASNPIMEAVGNAKTTRNDNSSRFGKYIQIGFSEDNTIGGANMRTYLLEKSRVVFQAGDERNYHIFYQLCTAASDPEFESLYLGINEIRRMDIFRILSGVLHLGNVSIEADERSVDKCLVPKTDDHIFKMSSLLGIEAEQIRYWLCNRKLVTAMETVTKPLTVVQACFSRDALAKQIYAQLFNWIVKELNKSLSTQVKASKFIGVLDIYGFETFEVNSFEQFCINYANEKLQQQFCLHVFKLEQDEYIREKISWSFIDFHDNQLCIELIEGKLGILDLLDEECRMPSASDSNWCQKLCSLHNGKSKHFEKPRLSQTTFIVIHFADKVEYTIDGFLEKNRDAVLDEHVNILKASQYELVAELFQETVADVISPTRRTNAPNRPVQIRPAKEQPKSTAQQKQAHKTVGSQFRESLKLLMETLFSTTPHYIRCIKPNDSKMSFTFDPKRAVQQLRACGVLETIRISAAGYPSRWTYVEFFQRYRVLARSKEIKRKDMRKTCELILNKLIQSSDKYQFGLKKIFFRAGQVAYLEKLRSDRLKACGVMMQTLVRGWLARRRYLKQKKLAHLLQTYGRGMVARRRALFMKRTKAALCIQTTWRCYHHRTKYRQIIAAVVTIQSYARSLFGRQHFVEVRANFKAVIIQRIVRGWLARRRYKKMLLGFIKLQAHVRRIAAKKELKKLKIEARSVEHMKNVARGLENKIIELQQKLTEKSKEVVLLRDDQQQLIDSRNEVVRLRSALSVNKVTADRITELELLVKQLTSDLNAEKEDKARILEDRDQIKANAALTLNRLAEEKSCTEKELNEAKDLIVRKERELDELIQKAIGETREMLNSEFEVERTHHQKVVNDYTRLQQRFENLQTDLSLLTSSSPAVAGNRLTPQETATPTNDDENVELTSTDTQGTANQNDISLVTRLQQRVKQLEWERSLMQRELDRKEVVLGLQTSDNVVTDTEKDICESIKLQELEMQYAGAMSELNAIRQAVAFDSKELIEKGHRGLTSCDELFRQFEAMQEELARRREECIQLRSVLSSQSRHIGEESYRDAFTADDDGELQMAYRTQKDLNIMLEKEIQQLQKETAEREKEMKLQIEDLKKDNSRQQKLISQNLSLTPQAKIEATMQHEITRLTSENLDLCEKVDLLQDQTRKLKKALKMYAKRLKLTEGEWRLSKLLSRSYSFASEVQEDLEREMANEEQNMPVVKHYEQRDYCGMFDYNKDDEMLLIKNLILELKPKLASQQLPGLPSYILFMCIRYTDYMNDDEKVRGLLTATINGIKKTVKKHQDDCEVVTLWLSNTCRLLHNLKQYSGDKVFQSSNTARQNEQCLRNFDLSEYRQILSDLAVWIFQGLVKLVEAQIHPLIVSAVLEHEAIAGLSTGKPSGLRGGRVQAGSLSQSRTSLASEDRSVDMSLDLLIKAFDSLLRVLIQHAVDTELIHQILKQLCYFICANALNNLLLRKDMCHWTKGMQIRYNLSHIEQWLRDNKMQETGVSQALEPIIQASQLLQARKTESDVDCICEMCSKLTTSQIIKILNLYTPLNEFEERVPISFIRRIQDKLSARHDSTQTLLMDTKFMYAITFPFNPSSIELETISVPSQWPLSFLKRL